MGNIRRYFPSNKSYFITNRLAEGLPFVPNEYMNLMLSGVLARAKSRFPGICLCGYMFMANHYHMLLVLNGDPQQLSGFMNYVDGELGKLVVRWLGKRNVKIWAQRYHAAPILTAESALKQLLYMFMNPVTANLVENAADWNGCSSFYAFNEKEPRSFKWYKQSHAALLPNGVFTKKLLRRLLSHLEELKRPSYVLSVEPFAWMKCFPDAAQISEEQMKKRFFENLRAQEQAAAKSRIKEKITVVGTKALAEQNPHRSYKPSKYCKRMWCISSCIELRIAYIEMLKELFVEAEQAWNAWVVGFHELLVPHGMFSPPKTPRGSIVFCPL